MTISIIRPGFLALLLVSTLAIQVSLADDNPHWKKDSCQTCHEEVSPTDGASLQASDAEALCESCHGSRGGAIPCRHSSGIPIGEMTIASELQSSIKDGQVVCSTCHDVVYQCKNTKLHFSLQNRGFLRDRTAREAGSYCIKCHDTSSYMRLSPHVGVAASPARPTCLLCHQKLPETSATGELAITFNFDSDLNDTCRGCHNTRPHPRSMSFTASANEDWVHLVQPSSDVLERKRVTQARTGIELPLDPQTGQVFCATCHNPHDFKVGGEHGSQSQDVKSRLRMESICEACHEK